MPPSGSQQFVFDQLRFHSKTPRKRAQKLPKFEPNSSKRLRAPRQDPLLYSFESDAVRRRKWLNADETRRVIESRARVLANQRKRAEINPHRARFKAPKRQAKQLKVGQMVRFVPPPHAKAKSLWKGQIIAIRGEDVVIDRSPALKEPRRQANIEVVSSEDCCCLA